MMDSFSDLLVEQYGDVAKLAAIYELRLRLIADQTPELKALSHSKRLEEIEEAFIAHFKTYLTQDGETLLKTGRQLRNKILHIDFFVAAQQIEKLKPNLMSKSNVLSIDLLKDTNKTVSNLSSKEVSIFGWLLETGASNGLFEHCRDIFAKMIALICTIRDEISKT